MSTYTPSVERDFLSKPWPEYLPSFVSKGRQALPRLAAAARQAWHDERPAVLVGGAFLFFIFGLYVFALSFPSRTAHAQDTAAAAAADTAPLLTQEMHIANNGLVLLRSARVVAVEGTTLTLSMGWGATDFNWVVLTDASTYGTHQFGTRFLDNSGKPSSLSEIEAGDAVTVTGMLEPNTQQPTIDADSVRKLE